jgi:5-methylcytosine-specific restriction endonuclease McrA
MLKAEIDGIGIPTRGTPQGGVLSPLLANVALNELDWWISSQWFDFKVRSPQKRSHKFYALKKTKLKEMFIVRYADDFKIFCRNYNDARKTFVAVKEWLETRLHLEVSPEKSKITNLRKNCSEFLGIKLMTGRKKVIIVKNQLVNKYLSRSYIADKAKEKILREIKFLTKRIQKSTGINAHNYINRYNAYVIGVHNYYNIATCCSCDFDQIASLSRLMRKNKLNLRKRKPGDKTLQYMSGYNKSEQLRFILDRPFLPIGYVKFKPHPSFNGVSPYIEADRNVLHKKQKAVSHEILRKLMSSPVLEGSIEFNDNRLSLFVAQYGKCAVTGIKLEIDNVHCHHKIPKSLGGGDEYKNLVILHKEVHRLIHASTTATIKRYVESLGLNKSKIEKVNSLRIKAQLEPIL